MCPDIYSGDIREAIRRNASLYFRKDRHMSHHDTNIQMNVLSPAIMMFAVISALLFLSGCGFTQLPGEEVEWVSDSRAARVVQPSSGIAIEQTAHVPERIVIDSIGLDTPVDDLGWSAAIDPAGRIFNNWNVTAYTAGWHVNSDRLGEEGNVVLSGHNNILGAVFRDLDKLKSGDIATLWSGDIRYDYEITDVFIVPERDATAEQRRQNATFISDFQDNRLTLVTCWPRNGNSHRVIVIGHFVDGTDDNALAPTASR